MQAEQGLEGSAPRCNLRCQRQSALPARMAMNIGIGIRWRHQSALQQQVEDSEGMGGQLRIEGSENSQTVVVGSSRFG